jgi:hypothetical protein
MDLPSPMNVHQGKLNQCKTTKMVKKGHALENVALTAIA